jgi:hypothetical protein
MLAVVFDSIRFAFRAPTSEVSAFWWIEAPTLLTLSKRALLLPRHGLRPSEGSTSPTQLFEVEEDEE